MKPTCSSCAAADQPCIYGPQKRKIDDSPVPDTKTTFLSCAQQLGYISQKQWSQNATRLDLPTKYVTDVSNTLRSNLVKLYLRMRSSPHLPFIPPLWILKELEASPLLFNAVCALAALTCPESLLEGHDHLQLAHSLYQNACVSMALEMEKQSASLVFALLVLSEYCKEVALNTSVLNYKSMAIGLALELGYNALPTNLPTTAEEHYENCIKINIWWSCFVIDQCSSSLCGNASIIEPSSCKVPLHVPEQAFQFEKHQELFTSRMFEIGVMSSDTKFLPVNSFPSMTPDIKHMLLLKIYVDVTKYEQKLIESEGVLTPELEFHEACLNCSLRDWFDTVRKPSQDGFQFGVEDIGYWWDWYLMIMYYAAVITLKRPKLSQLLLKQKSQALFSEDATLCYQSAQNISQIMAHFMEFNPSYSGVPGAVSHCIYVAGAIYSIFSKMHTDASIKQNSKTNNDLHLVLLKTLGDASAPCKVHYNLFLKMQSLETDTSGSFTTFTQDSNAFFFGGNAPDMNFFTPSSFHSDSQFSN
ncbi:hypothetical protein EDD86DRAFT_198909 [Gorgonomyces haynaldii]|nr:hypothetical protein EDD86DRAFT_198909 [Gorgonomyces haynaldii]